MEINHPDIIETLGGITAVANRLGIKPPSVSGWIADGKNGIPEGRLIELGADIERAGLHRRWDLRPNDWHVIWPELIGTKGAPKPIYSGPERRITANAGA
jgi:DNA-binding transcriptional regulator YdaS (Cro superfamily)